LGRDQLGFECSGRRGGVIGVATSRYGGPSLRVREFAERLDLGDR
jgi:hypothetical protein